MADIGAHLDGVLRCDLKKLDDGFVVPDASFDELHDEQRDRVTELLDLSIRADDLGYDYLVFPENHFQFLGSFSPNPLQLQTAAAARTDEIRLLQVANIVPWHHPLRLAEQVGTLDLLSDGRVEVGIGTGMGARQKAVFEQYREAPDGEYDVWEDFLEVYEILTAAWSDEYVAYDGEYHAVPPEGVEWDADHEYHYLADEASGRDPGEFVREDDDARYLASVPVFPRPQQQPHPQFWKPVASERSAEWTARHGVNACTFGHDFENVAELVEVYQEAAEDAGWPDHRPERDGEPFGYGWDEQRGRGIAANVPVFNTDVADEAAIERMRLGVEFLMSLQKSALPPERAAEFTIDYERRLERRDTPVVGGTEEIVDRLAAFEDVCGYEDLVVFASFSIPGLTYEQEREQLEAFATEVAPYFDD